MKRLITHGKHARRCIALALVLCAGCAVRPAAAHATTTRRPTLQFVGDSITWGATDGIMAHYGARYDVHVWGKPGIDSFGSVFEMAREIAAPHDIEVIGLGTNDTLIARHYKIADTLRQLDLYGRAFPRTTCVLFVNVTTHAGSTWSPSYAAAIDAHLKAKHVGHVVNWNAAYDARNFGPAYSYGPNPHPNERGMAAMLALEDLAIARCPR